MVKETILKVGTAEAVKNVGDLKKNIQELKKLINGYTEEVEVDGQKVKKTFEGLAIGSEEYRETLEQLQVNQQALKDAMHGTAASFDEVTNAATGANVAFKDNNELVTMEGVSYNALVSQLANLKQAWRSTEDEMTRAQLGERINAVNDKLKEMDASVGSYKRNVGNYIGAVDHLTSSFGAFGSGAQKVINPIKGATGALKAMSATPVIGILGILASVLEKIIGELKSSEENTNNMTAAMAPFAAIGDVVTKVLQGLGAAVTNLVSGFSKLMGAIFGTNKATEQRIALARQEAEMTKKERENIVKNAEAEREVARLRAEASDKTNHSAKERLALLEQAGEQERQIAERAMEAARMQYEIQKAKNALTDSNAEDLKKEAEAYAALVQAETAYYNKVREINAGITSARNEEAKAARDRAKEAENQRKAALDAEKALLSQEIALLSAGQEERLKKQKELLAKEHAAAVANAKEKIKDAEVLNRTLLALRTKYHNDVQQAEREHQQALRAMELKALENTANQYAQGTLQNLKALKELRQRELETMTKEEDETQQDFNARRLAAQWAYYEAIRNLNKKLVEGTTAELELAYAQGTQTTEAQLAYAQAMAEAKVRQIQTLGREAGETEEQYLVRLAEAQRAANEATQAVLDYADEQERLAMENRMATLEEDSLEYSAREIELKKWELDNLHKLEEESEEEFRARQLAADKAYHDAKRNLWKKSLGVMQQVASATSGILGSIADAMEENTEITKEEAEKAKNLRIASATIDMLQGAVTAYAGAQSLGVPMGPIIGAINAAAVVAAGIANIAKIKAQKIDTNSSSSQSASVPAQVSAPTVEPQVQQVRTVTGASEEERLDRMAKDRKVYLVTSELEAEQNDERVRVEEATF